MSTKMRKVYVVRELFDREYGFTRIIGVHSTKEKAQEIVDKHQYQNHPGWNGPKKRDALSIEVWQMDSDPDLNRDDGAIWERVFHQEKRIKRKLEEKRKADQKKKM